MDRSIGVLDEEDGFTYCVAPVSSAEDSLQVQFWAAGVNCCGHSRAFYCDDAQEPGSGSGVVVPTARSRRAALRSSKLYQAAAQASAAHGLQMPPKPLFVHWVKAPEEFR